MVAQNYIYLPDKINSALLLRSRYCARSRSRLQVQTATATTTALVGSSASAPLRTAFPPFFHFVCGLLSLLASWRLHHKFLQFSVYHGHGFQFLHYIHSIKVHIYFIHMYTQVHISFIYQNFYNSFAQNNFCKYVYIILHFINYIMQFYLIIVVVYCTNTNAFFFIIYYAYCRIQRKTCYIVFFFV